MEGKARNEIAFCYNQQPMPSDAAIAIAYVGASVGLIGGGVSLFNAWKAVCWKRAELANSYMKDFNNTPELVFAGRCLDWNGGRLILPESLRPYMPNQESVIVHDRAVFAKAVSPFLQLSDMDQDPRIQIYRTALDGFLSWLSLVASALDRRLFQVADIQDVGYWTAKIQSEVVIHPFIIAYGYKENIEKLIRVYRAKNSPYKDWSFEPNLIHENMKPDRDAYCAPMHHSRKSRESTPRK